MKKLNYKDELIFAAFMCDASRVKNLVAQPEFNKRMIEDIGIFDNPFPLYYTTILAKQVFAQEFIEEVMPIVLQIRKNCEELTAFWKEQFGIDIDSIHIDYRLFSNYFFCSQDEDDQYLDDFTDYEHIHARRIDYDLFEEAVRFNRDAVIKLLQQGANPHFEFYTESDIMDAGTDDEWIDKMTVMDRIGEEASFLCTCQVMPVYKSYYNHHKDYHLSANDYGEFIGWAAHEDMEAILSK